MLKRIREEKTFKANMKSDIQEALLNLNNAANEEENKGELEVIWLEELIERKKHEQSHQDTKEQQLQVFHQL